MGSLLIVKDGKVVYSRAIGYAQIEGTTKKPLTTTSRFWIASSGKMYTADCAVIQRIGRSITSNNRVVTKSLPSRCEQMRAVFFQLRGTNAL